FQIPRKTVLCHHQGNKKPLNPPTQVKQKPTEPTSSSWLPALISSALSDNPWEKVPSPPPHEPQCSAMPVFLHIKEGSAPLHAAQSRREIRCMQEYRHTEKSVGFSSYVISDNSIQSEDRFRLCYLKIRVSLRGK
ncbi:hypothetical protein GOODEAATRI_031401, partial [Goodea atripinnis]